MAGLFSAAFLSATLLPGGSEGYLALFLKPETFVISVIVATVGNTFGAFTNYLIGRFFIHLSHGRLFGFSKRQRRRARLYFRKYGGPVLFFSFLPVIGDPLTAIAGIMRYKVEYFFLWVTTGKLIRYILWSAGVLYFFR